MWYRSQDALAVVVLAAQQNQMLLVFALDDELVHLVAAPGEQNNRLQT